MTRTVVISGGGTGIGRAAAARFAAEGNRVVITGRRTDVLGDAAADLGERVRAVHCDHTHPGDLLRLAGELTSVDVLVNNAGGNPTFGQTDPVDLPDLLEMWTTNLATNLLAAVLTTHALWDKLSEGAAVIHIGSTAMTTGGTATAAAKAGLAAWNAGLARQLGQRRITCNVLAPGFTVDTDYFHGRDMQEMANASATHAATGRVSTPNDIAGVIEFLASPAAAQITGQVVFVNGGSTTTR
jgi:3-oxoacyl-[acyl-carrier protein] reductase